MKVKAWMFSSSAMVGAVAMTMAACSTDRGVLAPTEPNAYFVGTPGLRQPQGEALVVCKDFIGATGTATFTVTGTENGVAITPTNFSVADGQCLDVWYVDVGVNGVLTVTENTPTGAGWATQITGIQMTNHVQAALTPINGKTSSAVNLAGNGTGALLIFRNTFTPPPQGCTLTQGYWKTHSSYGPAAADPDWFNLGDFDTDGVSEGPDEAFFNSGKTWIQLWGVAPGQAGNQTPALGKAYVQLAHQYMAAKLNIANGATPTGAVTTAINGATTFFQAGNLTAVPNSTWAGTLASFNEGAIGPGHCGS